MQQLNMSTLQKKLSFKLLALKSVQKKSYKLLYIYRYHKQHIIAAILFLALLLSISPLSAQVLDSSLETRRIVVNSESGKHMFFVKIADTDSKRSQGLKYIKSLDESTGMLFTYEYPVEASFWMKDTYIPLDIIFINQNYKIDKIEALTQPLSEKSIRSIGKVIAVLEIKGGLSWQKGINIGDLVEFK